jgi:hypothetical protein
MKTIKLPGVHQAVMIGVLVDLTKNLSIAMEKYRVI